MAAAKQSLRQKMRQLRSAISSDEAAQAARRAAANLLQLAELRAARTVALYAAREGELDTGLAAEALRKQGLTLAFPRVLARQRTLAFFQVDDLGSMARGAFGIPEPAPGAAAVALDAVDLFVVPGLAFDGLGGRLGWGQGHYDATLAATPAIRVGFAHGCQIVDEVPRDPHDLLMDLVVTDADVMITGARARESGQ